MAPGGGSNSPQGDPAQGAPITVGEALARARAQLASAGVEGAEREAAWLMAHVLGCTAGVLIGRKAEPLAPETARAYAALTARRAAREPLQYILGTEEFLGLTFRVTPAVLIPRLDTAVLVEQAVARLAAWAAGVAPAAGGVRAAGGARAAGGVWAAGGAPAAGDLRIEGGARAAGGVRAAGGLRVADIGTGSGAIAVAVAHRVPAAHVLAVDVSREALAVAAENARLNGVADRVRFRQGDLVAPLREEGGRFAAILSNPPYISEAELTGLMPEVRDWEPRLALSAGADGLAFFRRLVREAPAFLLPGGFLGVEVGIGQAQAVAGLFREAGLVDVAVYPDTAGVERAVFGSVTS